MKEGCRTFVALADRQRGTRGTHWPAGWTVAHYFTAQDSRPNTDPPRPISAAALADKPLATAPPHLSLPPRLLRCRPLPWQCLHLQPLVRVHRSRRLPRVPPTRAAAAAGGAASAPGRGATATGVLGQLLCHAGTKQPAEQWAHKQQLQLNERCLATCKQRSTPEADGTASQTGQCTEATGAPMQRLCHLGKLVLRQ